MRHKKVGKKIGFEVSKNKCVRKFAALITSRQKIRNHANY